MKKSVKSIIIFLLINIALFYILPLLIVDTGSAMIILLAILPLSCLFVAVIYGSLNSFHIAYPLLIALAFTPTIWIFFNESAWVYIPAYGVITLIGNLIGAGIYKYGNHKTQGNNSRCPICSGARAVKGINDLATLRPELAKQWSVNLDKRENELTDDEPDEGDETLGRSNKERER